MTALTPCTLTEELRQATRIQHDALETLPFFQALLEDRLPKESYVHQLKSLAILFSVLEYQLTQVDHRVIRNVLDGYQPKYPLIAADLEALDATTAPDHPRGVAAGLALADHVLLRRSEAPVSLLGYLYVLEGSTLGGVVLRPHYERCFGSEALSFLSSYNETVDENWARFSSKVNGALLTAEEHAVIVEAAVECFEGFHAVYAALDPAADDAKQLHVTSINPEAGNHPIPTDPVLVSAAIRAADLCWKHFPYYERRYGQRGLRYSRSDSAWLTTLADMSEEDADKQVRWLTGFLAAKGMPTLTMQIHLQFLHEELVREAPDQGPWFEKLRTAAKALETERQQQIGPADAERLAREFASSTGEACDASFHDAADIVVAAVADECNGYKGALESVTEWMTDPGRFDGRWIEGIHELIREAQRLAKASL